MSDLHYCVIGSGPAGVACTRALIERGIRVTILDVGKSYNRETLASIRRLQVTPLDEWKNSEIYKELYSRRELSETTIPKKRVFGSDFPYEDDRQLNLNQLNTKCLISHAKGGLSNVWGGAVLPFRSEDFQEWPISLSDLIPYYEIITKEMGISGVRDDLEVMYPLYTEPQGVFELSNQGKHILNVMQRSRKKLNAKGIYFGQSRIGVNLKEGKRSTQCCYQGVCLEGCPFFVIYNSMFSLDKLILKKECAYISNIAVSDIEEISNNKVRVNGFSENDSTQKTFLFDKVFIACGPIASAKIVIHTLKKYDHVFNLKYHPYFLLPLVSLNSVNNVSREKLHTLSQLFIEVVNKKISDFPLHLQLYGYNSFLEDKLDSFMLMSRSRIKHSILNRLLLLQGYLHSSEVEGIQFKIKCHSNGQTSIDMKSKRERKVNKIMRSLALFLFFNRKSFGFWPLYPFGMIGSAGDGNHIGSLFPMKKKPRENESDYLGRVAPLKRTHIVDSSILTSLPPSTLTLTVMANAYRIGDKVPLH